MNKSILIFIITLTLFGCSGDPYEAYVGLWEYQGKGREAVMEISKDGETMLVTENILGSRSFITGKPEKPKTMVLKKSEGQLSIGAGFGGVTFGLSESGDTLRVADRSYVRINNNRLDEIKETIVARKQEQEENQKLCLALKEEYQKVRKGFLNKYGSVPADDFEKYETMKGEFKKREKAIANCTAWIL